MKAPGSKACSALRAEVEPFAVTISRFFEASVGATDVAWRISLRASVSARMNFGPPPGRASVRGKTEVSSARPIKRPSWDCHITGCAAYEVNSASLEFHRE